VVAVLVVLVVVGAVLARRRSDGAADAADKVSAGRRNSFNEIAATIVQSTSMENPAYETAAVTENLDFEGNGFVLDEEGASIRLKSCRRQNPAFTGSIYAPEDAVGVPGIEEDSIM